MCSFFLLKRKGFAASASHQHLSTVCNQLQCIIQTYIQMSRYENNACMQGVTAIAVNVVSSPAPWLAAAQRISKRTVRVTVYALVPDVSLASRLHSTPTSQIFQADLTEPLLVKVPLS